LICVHLRLTSLAAASPKIGAPISGEMPGPQINADKRGSVRRGADGGN
jgi:hypothetical protein